MEAGAPAASSKAHDAPAIRPGFWEDFTRFLGRREVLPLLLVTPVLVFFIVWNLIPTLWLLGLGFYRFSLTSGRPPRFAGLYNYQNILNDAGIWFDLSRTFIFVFLRRRAGDFVRHGPRASVLEQPPAAGTADRA